MSTPAVPAPSDAAPVPRVARGVGIALAFVTLLQWWPIRGFRPDDTYIHLQYAKHLRDGHGLVFNLGERVYGTTSPLWSGLLGAVGALGIDLRVAATALSLGAALAAAALGARVFARFLGAAPAAPRLVRLAVLLAALAWAAAALVRPEAALLGVLLVVHAALDPRGGQARRSGVLAAAGPLLALGVPWVAATWA